MLSLSRCAEFNKMWTCTKLFEANSRKTVNSERYTIICFLEIFEELRKTSCWNTLFLTATMRVLTSWLKQVIYESKNVHWTCHHLVLIWNLVTYFYSDIARIYCQDNIVNTLKMLIHLGYIRGVSIGWNKLDWFLRMKKYNIDTHGEYLKSTGW